MPDQIFIGDAPKGLQLDTIPLKIDNASFATLYNFYAWRKRVKRKRGTSALARLQVQVESVLTDTPPLAWQYGQLTLTGGAGNLITGFGLKTNSSIVPGSISVDVGGNTYTEPSSPDGTLTDGTGGTGTINYATGAITITGGGAGPLTGTFSYFPDLPVLGLEDFVVNPSNSKFPSLIAFDTTYAYQLNQVGGFNFYNVSFYKNTNNPVIWSNTDSNQFWSTNYQSAFWVTNNKPGFHFLTGTYTSGSGTNTITFNFKTSGVNFTTLVVGDVLFFNEWPSVASPLININGLNGTVSSIAGAAAGNYVVTFTTTPTVSATGIVQMLTNSLPGQDGIRWYDGDPTSTTGLPTGTGFGWVNFAPPLTATNVSYDDQQQAKYYLVGALAIVPFKDRLLFMGPQIQTSSGSVIQQPIQDNVLWSWNGTPYYNALVPTSGQALQVFNNAAYYVDQTGQGGYLPAGVDQPIVTVLNNEDVLLIGFGGSGKKTRLIYTGNDIQPFLFYLINSELPSSSTFSGITLDRGGIEIGQYGITLTTQQSCQRIDLEIPDSVFEIQGANSGYNRVNAVRDFQSEWIYFSYPIGGGIVESQSWVYPAQTLLFNYRDNTWAIFRESFTHHGTFRRSVSYTWLTLPYKTWDEWRVPWTSGSSQAMFPQVIAGNPQGYVIIKGSEGTGEAPTGYISNITNNGGFTQITSANHCVNSQSANQGFGGDYLSFGGTTIGLVTQVIDINNFVVDIPYPGLPTVNITAITQANQAVVTLSWAPAISPPNVNSYFVGQTVSIAGVVGMTELNGNTYTILAVTPTTIALNVNSTGFTAYVSGGTTTLVSYVGLANYTRLIQPLLQTKQFPVYWNEGRKTTLKSQRYLLDSTQNSQITLDIYLSQDINTAYNSGTIVPDPNSENNALIYSQLLYTCPESTNLGLTQANSNLQNLVAPMTGISPSSQIWHRVNTSLIGDSIQLGLTLSDAQMRNLSYATDEIVLHGIQLTTERGPLLA
jgi:hypothetical protein